MKAPVLTIITYFLIVFRCFAQADTGSMKTHFIDVGQGSATLLEFSCGVVLIDAGGENNSVVDSEERLKDYLQNFFSERNDLNNTIDLFVLTHAHLDHTLGAKYVFDSYTVNNVITNGKTYGSGMKNQNAIQDAIKDLASNANTSDDIGYHEAIADNIGASGITNDIIDPLDCSNGDPQIKLFWGTMINQQDLSNSAYTNGNNHSVVMKVSYGQSAILITGDLEEDALDLLVDKHAVSIDADLYVAGHHASKNGTTKRLLEAVTPKIAVMSFGDLRVTKEWTAWAYGHPNADIVEMLRNSVSDTRAEKEVWVGDGAKNFYPIEVDKAIYGTGWDGGIVFDASFDGTWSAPILTETKFRTRKILISVNTASQYELEKLPGIGPTKALAIIEYRRANGSFSTLNDLDNVPGIGQSSLNQIKDLIRF
ncbi:MAG: helix-hairpin-helix domain-containing protein [Reichenbachiella sp.]|uniref:helix-hairpin-helix domain-containing protein n=1 Tax=Reichenbachiella sp. TaxID=2184521 RepID=UPI0032649DCB